MSESIWKIPYTKPDCSALKDADISPLLAEILVSRGFTSPAEASAFLHTGPEQLHDPLEILGMREARDRVLLAISQKETITVYGDYDVDGITATCLLTDYLRSLGLNCSWYIPDRSDEGYGLNSDALQKIRNGGSTLVISVDCGITASEEADFARSIGLDLVITDHHECKNGTIPDACAVIDPKRPDDNYPNPELAGVGVAFKLVSACCHDQVAVLDRYADLVAVGTIADVMPLTGENRYLVQCGLKKLETNPRPGFYAMMNEPGSMPRKPNAGVIGFTMAPRLNAAGRLGQTEKAEQLMLTADPAEAERLTAELGELNRERQKIENEIWREAQKQLDGHPPDEPIVLAAENWHQGVIGIAASRLSEQYGVPTVMISLCGENGKGSCRSCSGFNLYEALSACSDQLEGFGGHALAAGLTIHRDKIDSFREALCQYYASHHPLPQADVCCDLLVCDSELLSIENVTSLDLLEPFGSANPKPVLCISNALLLSAYGVGAQKQHLKFAVEFDGIRFDGIFFSRTREALGVRVGDRVDLAFTPQINQYMGNTSVQLTASAMRIHCPQGLCDRILDGDSSALWAAGAFIPERSDFVSIWKRYGTSLHVPSCLEDVLSSCPPEMAPERFCLCLAVFSEAGLLHSEDGSIYRSCYIQQEKKADLNATEIMKILRAL